MQPLRAKEGNNQCAKRTKRHITVLVKRGRVNKQQRGGIRQAKQGWIQTSPSEQSWGQRVPATGAALTQSLPGVQRSGFASANLKVRAPEESLSTAGETEIRFYLTPEGRANEFEGAGIKMTIGSTRNAHRML